MGLISFMSFDGGKDIQYVKSALSISIQKLMPPSYPFSKGIVRDLKRTGMHTHARARTHTHTHRHRRVLCDFCGIFKNTYFVEHLQGTTSHFMTYWNKCRVPESVIRFNYGNLVFKTICSNVLITLKINVHRLNHK